MTHHTDISRKEGEEHRIRGSSVASLMRDATFTDVIHLLLAGSLPDKGARALLDAMLVASCEHGIETPSSYVPRISVASGNPPHVALAAGILAIGESHGGAGEACARLLASNESPEEIVARHMKEARNIPGFGHRLYKEEDPRATIVFEKAKEAGLALTPFEKAYEIAAELERRKGKKLPLNIDGALAAGTLVLGMDASAATLLFVIARVSGMSAHAIEERAQGNPYWRLES